MYRPRLIFAILTLRNHLRRFGSRCTINHAPVSGLPDEEGEGLPAHTLRRLQVLTFCFLHVFRTLASSVTSEWVGAWGFQLIKESPDARQAPHQRRQGGLRGLFARPGVPPARVSALRVGRVCVSSVSGRPQTFKLSPHQPLPYFSPWCLDNVCASS